MLEMYGQGMVNERTEQRWPGKFHCSEFDLDDEKDRGCSSAIDNGELKRRLKASACDTIRESEEEPL
ncbi:unnamed protein product [Angiostrongylus costaricensis]|uniref:Histone-lysine N-methyltransferase SETMAR n=1 Tax=Angiostrongylus costaricensis TaxID=334426 RepID=A0A0R3PF41_ANGCS|nr:unnamed protein product [Angiostrongylus costaricensis]